MPGHQTADTIRGFMVLWHMRAHTSGSPAGQMRSTHRFRALCAPYLRVSPNNHPQTTPSEPYSNHPSPRPCAPARPPPPDRLSAHGFRLIGIAYPSSGTARQQVVLPNARSWCKWGPDARSAAANVPRIGPDARVFPQPRKPSWAVISCDGGAEARSAPPAGWSTGRVCQLVHILCSVCLFGTRYATMADGRLLDWSHCQ